MTLPVLSIVCPVRSLDDPQLAEFLQSLDCQDMPKGSYEVILETRGNSEEAKWYGIQRARGEIIGFFCIDNVIRYSDFLRSMVQAAQAEGVTGAYTRRYAYVKKAPPLDRYFALLGANDPLCWWIGKADRESYLSAWGTRLKHQLSLGDNGCFIKRALILQVLPKEASQFGSCMCLCEDLRQAGHSTWTVLYSEALWHKTGISLLSYLKRRHRYVRELYWQRKSVRRWHMVSTRQDWIRVVLFALSSLLVLPHLWLSYRGYRRVQDPAWFIHPGLCFLITCLYSWLIIEHLWRRLWSAPTSVLTAIKHW